MKNSKRYVGSRSNGFVRRIGLLLFGITTSFLCGCGNREVESFVYDMENGRIWCDCGSEHEISKVRSRPGKVKDAWLVTVEWFCNSPSKRAYYFKTDEIILKKGKRMKTIKIGDQKLLYATIHYSWWVYVIFSVVSLVFSVFGETIWNSFFDKLPPENKLRVHKKIIENLCGALIVFLIIYYFGWPILVEALA